MRAYKSPLRKGCKNWDSSFIHNSAKNPQQKCKEKIAELKKIISLTFKKTTAWVASKVYVHMHKTAEHGTNVHCSILLFDLQNKYNSAFVSIMMNKKIPPKL